MKSIAFSVALLGIFTSLAQADEVLNSVSDSVRDSYAQMSAPRSTHAVPVSMNVVVDGKVIGRDPSEAVRSAIAGQYYSLSATGGEGGGGDAGGGAAAE